VTREPNFDELIDAETTGAERERLRRTHELLLQAGSPPELSPELERGPTLGMTLQRPRRAVKPRAMLLLAAAIAIVLVFVAGYAVGNGRNGKSTAGSSVIRLALKGTSLAPNAQATLEVWQSEAGNRPMRLSVVGLPQLPGNGTYDVYLVRNGKPWGSCGTFRVAGSSGPLTVSLNAPYSLRKGDIWVVTQPGPGGSAPGKTVLSQVRA
jgi:hypothetical protein